MAFRLMSWNIESLGEKKLARKAGFSVSQYIANVIFFNNVDLLVIMEVSPSIAPYLINEVTTALDGLQAPVNAGQATRQQWVAIHSDRTGKTGELPATIRPYDDFAKGVDRDAFFKRTMVNCYKRSHQDEDDEEWTLLPPAKRARVSDVLEGAIRLNLIKPDQEDYVAFFRCDVTPPAGYGSYWNSLATIGISYFTSVLRSQAPGGSDLGFQTSGSAINGRMPWRMELTTGTLLGSAFVPLIVYHTLYGSSADLDARVFANQQLLSLGVVNGVPPSASSEVACSAAPFAILCGDFNVDNDASPYTATLPILTTAPYAVQVWGFYIASGFALATNAKTSLLVRDAAPPPSPNNSLSYRSSAYDNIVVKPTTAGTMTNAGVFDAIADLSANGMARAGRAFADMYSAFDFYRKNISDHLPVMATINTNY